MRLWVELTLDKYQAEVMLQQAFAVMDFPLFIFDMLSQIEPDQLITEQDRFC